MTLQSCGYKFRIQHRICFGGALTACLVNAMLAGIASAADNGQALLPPMGWLSWERFRCNTDCVNDPENCLSENLIREMADRLAEDGFAKAGYTVVGIDDCWLSNSRDSSGRLQPNVTRFPQGIAKLSEYIHARGLEFGIYGDIGTKTCGGYPGMADHLKIDAQTYADWGVDYLKVDGCYADTEDFSKLYPLLGKYLNETGRKIIYSCSWPAYLPDPVATSFQVPYEALREHCNLWRNWLDIQDSWDSLAGILKFWAEATLKSTGFQEVAGPGAWNDPDMLIIGNQGLNEKQSRVQMGMWAIFASPLLMSNDLRHLSREARSILLNQQAIEINQDPLGIQGELLACPGGCKAAQLWRRRLSGGKLAAAFLNLSEESLEGRLCISIPDTTNTSHWQVMEVFESRTDLPVVGGELCIDHLEPTSLALFHVAELQVEKDVEKLSIA